MCKVVPKQDFIRELMRHRNQNLLGVMELTLHYQFMHKERRYARSIFLIGNFELFR